MPRFAEQASRLYMKIGLGALDVRTNYARSFSALVAAADGKAFSKDSSLTTITETPRPGVVQGYIISLDETVNHDAYEITLAQGRSFWRHLVRQFPLLSLLYGLLLFPTAPLLAQSSLSDVVGLPPDAAKYPIPGVGFVNLNNGNLHIDIPVRTVKDRNDKLITTSLVYDSSIFQQIDVPVEGGDPSGCGPGSSPECGGQAMTPVWTAYVGANPNVDSPGANQWSGGLRIVANPDYSGHVSHTTVTFQGCAGGTGGTGNGTGFTGCASGQIYSNWAYIEGNGTIHPFPSNVTTGDAALSAFGYGPTAQVIAQDGSGYWLQVTNATNGIVYDSHGNQTDSGYDTNGNHTQPGSTDKLGRYFYSAYLPSGFMVTSKTINIWTDFDGGGSGDINSSGIVLSSLTLPGGRSYSFQYDDASNPAQLGHYGSLTGITLPTGGQINITNEVVQFAGANPNPNVVVKQITTPDGTWTFSYPSPGLITVTAPTDPRTGLASQTTCACGPVTQTVSAYAGTATGAPFRTITRRYGYAGQLNNIETTLETGLSSHVAYTYADVCTPRVASRTEYDFSGNPLRETDVSYFTSPSDNTNLCTQWNAAPPWTDPYLQNNHHITDIPASVTVYGPSGSSSGSPMAQTIYTYDSTAITTTSGSSNNSVLGLSIQGGAIHDDVNFSSTMTIRGNLTGISKMTSVGNFTTTATNYFNILGELVKTADGNGNSTNFDFTDSWSDSSCVSSPVFAYPTTVTNALGQLTKSTYNSCDGSIANTQDQNDINAGRTGTVTTYDGLQRVTSISYPDGGSHRFDYGGTTIPEVITDTVAINNSQSKTNTTILDGLGRTIRTALTSDPVGIDYVDTTYDPLGRVASVSNPYRTPSTPNDPPFGMTSYGYDALGRIVLQCQQDNGQNTPCQTGNSYLKWSYAGNVVSYTDEVGNLWTRTSDALGNLINVVEPGNIPTVYTYDALNNLKTVNQMGKSPDASRQSRTFNYDSLSRLMESYNPESGYTCYGTTGGSAPNGSNCASKYDADGNLLAKTDARGVVTTYAYDALNRVLSKTYSNAPAGSLASCFQYDTATNGIGRLGVDWTQSGTCAASPANPKSLRTILAYDVMGRVLQDQRCTGIRCNSPQVLRPMAYSYDLAGNPTGSGDGVSTRSFITQYDQAGRLLNFSAGVPGSATSLFSVQSYGPVGWTGATIGPQMGVQRTYDSRTRLTGETVVIP